jgi:hypothetical protein
MDMGPPMNMIFECWNTSPVRPGREVFTQLKSAIDEEAERE